MSTKRLRIIGLVLAGISLICVTAASRAQLILATGENAEVSEDGLHRVDREQIAGGWAKPDLDLSGYSRIYFQPTGVAFRDVDEVAPDIFNARPDEIFAISEIRQGQLREQFAEAIYEAIGDLDDLTITTEVGRDVLLVRGSLIDFVSAVPPDTTGSQTLTVRWAYAATLLIELRDSMSDEILARTMERQRAHGPIDVNDVTILTPRLFTSWANRLASNVQQFGALAR